MGKIIGLVNQKGGVGKTTTAVNLTAALKNRGKKVLLCDFDPQANGTSGMGVSKNEAFCSYHVLFDASLASRAVVRTPWGDVLPSNKMLSGAAVELVDMENREFKLKSALETLRGAYDFILIDCPPSLELLTLNGLCASDSVIIPVQCEYYALEGVSDLEGTLKAVQANFNPSLQVEGVVLTMHTGRQKLCEQVCAEVRWYYGDKVFKTVIPRNVRLSEAPGYGQPAVIYDKRSKGAKAYMDLAKELIKRQGKK